MNIQNTTNIFLAWKKELITSAVIIAGIALFLFFPTQGSAQAVTASLVFLFLIPLLYLKLILKKSSKNYGWQLGDWKKGVAFALISLVVSLLIFYILFQYTNFSQNYQLPLAATQKFWFFLFYEFLLVGFFLALYEFFFRGFVMFSFSQRLGLLSPFFQFSLFALFLFAAGSFDWENVFYLITSFFSGWIAYQSRSLLYSFVFSLAFIFIADALIIKLVY